MCGWIWTIVRPFQFDPVRNCGVDQSFDVPLEHVAHIQAQFSRGRCHAQIAYHDAAEPSFAESRLIEQCVELRAWFRVNVSLWTG
jgi:hypothetical protein